MSEKIVQTAGREQLGDFSPMFAHLNDDVLSGEVWNEKAISVKTKCIITVVSLMASVPGRTRISPCTSRPLSTFAICFPVLTPDS